MARPLRPELRESLLTIAAKHFARNGLHSSNLDTIAAEAGVTKGAIYFHFRSKLALFLSALERLESIRDARLASVETTGQPIEALRRLLCARFELYRDFPELRRLYWILDLELATEVSTALRDGIRADYRQLRATLRQLIHQAARAGQVEVTDAAGEAFRLAGCVEGALAQHAASADDVALFLDSDALVETWLARLRPRRGGRQVRQTPQESSTDDSDFRPAF